MAGTPQFEHRDPAEPAFWDERFRKGFTPWDAGRVPAQLSDFVARQGTPLATLVPGCGAAYEVRWLAERGWPVQAIDFSAAALDIARATLGPYADCVQQADFFDFTPAHTPGWVYERAFLCALPPALHTDYARRMAEILPSGAWLAGYFYVIDDAPDNAEAPRRGPPFVMRRDALHTLLSDAFALVDEAPATDSLPVFGTAERWMAWRRR